MNDDEFKKYKNRIMNELIRGFVFLSEEEFDRRLKNILDEIIENNQTTWTIHYPENMRRK
jgi:hypothetical protein